MDSHRSTSCRTHEIMRINECVVEHRTVQHVNQLFYIIHVALILFVLWYGAMFDSYNPDCFWTMDRLFLDSKDDHHHVLRMKYKYGVMLAYAQECTRRTHTVSCGWTNVHDMLRNEPHLQIQRISTSKPLHAPCSAMRLMDDTRKRCNEKTTYIMPCVWDHAHDVMRQWCDASGTRAVFHSWYFA